MRILNASVQNFGSYESLDFEFDAQGLTLISGPTGSGKSTLCDVIPWILFGRTSKDGAVDEVLAWDASGPTTGTITLDSGDSITRIRGHKANDLYMNAGMFKRGKDLADTQKLINELLGMDAEMYLAGSYLHEFSQTAQFFTSNAKTRRQTTERLVDTTLANNLKTASDAYKKELKSEAQTLGLNISKLTTEIQYAKQSVTETKKQATAWDTDVAQKVADLEAKSLSFDADQMKTVINLKKKSVAWQAANDQKLADLEAQIEALKLDYVTDIPFQKAALNKLIAAQTNELCETCGSPRGHQTALLLQHQKHQLDKKEQANRNLDTQIRQLSYLVDQVKQAEDPYPEQIRAEYARKNTFLDQIEALTAQENPFTKTIAAKKQQVSDLEQRLDAEQAEHQALKLELADLDTLGDLVSVFRTRLIESTIAQLEQKTNQLLEKHFDAEIRVGFSSDTADRIDVSIRKDGHEASFTQLSKGQRRLLQLCFGVSVMRLVQQHNAISFNCLFFDEALDGTSDELKQRAYGLLEELSLDYGSVYCVDHSEALKSLFLNRIDVSLNSGHSHLRKST